MPAWTHRPLARFGFAALVAAAAALGSSALLVASGARGLAVVLCVPAVWLPVVLAPLLPRPARRPRPSTVVLLVLQVVAGAGAVAAIAFGGGSVVVVVVTSALAVLFILIASSRSFVGAARIPPLIGDAQIDLATTTVREAWVTMVRTFVITAWSLSVPMASTWIEGEFPIARRTAGVALLVAVVLLFAAAAGSLAQLRVTGLAGEVVGGHERFGLIGRALRREEAVPPELQQSATRFAAVTLILDPISSVIAMLGVIGTGGMLLSQTLEPDGFPWSAYVAGPLVLVTVLVLLPLRMRYRGRLRAFLEAHPLTPAPSSRIATEA